MRHRRIICEPKNFGVLAFFFRFFLRVFRVQSLKIGVFFFFLGRCQTGNCQLLHFFFRAFQDVVLHLLHRGLGDSNGFIQFCCDFDSLPSLPHFAVPAWSMGKQQGAGTTHAGAACEEPCWIGSSKRRRVWRMMPTWISQAIKFWETPAQGVNTNTPEKHRKNGGINDRGVEINEKLRDDK